MTRTSPFRRIAAGTWRDPRDPTIYATFRVRAEPALAYLEAVRRSTGLRISMTHLMIKAAGEALRACPEANSILRFGRVRRRETADVSVLVLCGERGARDLASAKIASADEKDLAGIAAELTGRVEEIRSGADPLE
ncbi:MAG TPA: 2-oxo acid dehydrogenase subunit E2, partial [Myxococcales bacterium]|nr:2-oxo acid dehydrogenase subunit E2 [Myxococcales bacterium]